MRAQWIWGRNCRKAASNSSPSMSGSRLSTRAARTVPGCWTSSSACFALQARSTLNPSDESAANNTFRSQATSSTTSTVGQDAATGVSSPGLNTGQPSDPRAGGTDSLANEGRGPGRLNTGESIGEAGAASPAWSFPFRENGDPAVGSFLSKLSFLLYQESAERNQLLTRPEKNLQNSPRGEARLLERNGKSADR